MSRYLVDRIEADPRIAIRTNTTIVALEGDDTLRSLAGDGVGGTDGHRIAGLFSFIGADAGSGGSPGVPPSTTEGSCSPTDRSVPISSMGDGAPSGGCRLPFETSHPGLFAVGDLRSGSTKRVAAAVGEGLGCRAFRPRLPAVRRHLISDPTCKNDAGDHKDHGCGTFEYPGIAPRRVPPAYP